MAFNERGTTFIAATLSHEVRTEIVWLESDDGGRTFSVDVPSADAGSDRKWWPNLERPTGHNVIAGRPSLLFAAGVRGEGNTDILTNDVYWAQST